MRHEGPDHDRAHDAYWPDADMIAEHRIALDVLRNIASEDDGGDALDVVIDRIIDDTSDLRALVKLAVQGDTDAGSQFVEYAQRVARQYAYQVAWEKA